MNFVFMICITTLLVMYLRGAQGSGRGICEEGKFNCENGQCIRSEYRCDGDNNCADGSDEAHCETCSSTAFRCKSGRCIPQNFECDNDVDCPDGSDEVNCSAMDDGIYYTT